MNKPRFTSLKEALEWIKEQAAHEAAEFRELRIWQTMQQRDIAMGGGWD